MDEPWRYVIINCEMISSSIFILNKSKDIIELESQHSHSHSHLQSQFQPTKMNMFHVAK